MTRQAFSNLLFQLGEELDLNLNIDAKGACSLTYNDEIEIQLEPSSNMETLFIGTFITEISPGKFREEVLKNALKMNDQLPYIGTLSYCKQNNALFFFRTYPLSQLTGHDLALFLSQFLAFALSWKKTIQEGHTLPDLFSLQGESIF